VLQKLRDSHHHVAALFARGIIQTEISAITGYTPTRLSMLQNDPAFQELVSFYRERRGEIMDKAVERLKSLGMDALSILQEKLDENPDDFSMKELIHLLTVTMDRTGHGPTRKIENTNLNLTPGDVALLHSLRKQEAVIIVHEHRSEEDREPADGLLVEHRPGVESQETPGLESQGDSVREENHETAIPETPADPR
jgi:hypothetical protein